MSFKSPARVNGPAAFGAAMLAALVVGLVAGVVMALLQDVEGPGLLRLSGVGLAVFALLLVISVWWWRRIDEAAREAHKWAWWWGGCTGMGLAAVAAVALGHVRGVMPDALISAPPEHLLSIGGLAAILCQIVGYTVAWCVWWLRRI